MLIALAVVIVSYAVIRSVPAPPKQVDFKQAMRERMGHADYRACGE